MRADVSGWEEVVAWITQVLDEDEAHASDPVYCAPIWPSREQILARIAADRQILERLRALKAERQERRQDYSDWIDGKAGAIRQWQFSEDEIGEIPGLEYAVRQTTSAYADRPGYREEWRP